MKTANSTMSETFSSAPYAIFLSFMLMFGVMPGNGQTIDQPEAPQVTIAGTQTLQITSAITNKDYELYVFLPAGYKDTTKTFPVVYLIDAQWDFALLQALYGQQYYDGFIPEMVIVGITWGGKNPDYDKLRAHDFTPSDINNTGAYGNAPKFHSFIADELIPYIEGKYRVKPNDRTLIGSSFGGLFSLFAMFQEPAIFQKFIFTSPAIQWDNKYIYALNNQYAEKHKELPVKVFSAIGEYENVGEFEAFCNEIKAKEYKDFKLETKVIAGMGHSGAKADGYSRGLQSVFARPDFSVDPAILASYVGEYAMNPQVNISLVLEEGKLIAVSPDNYRIQLKASGNEAFYVPGQFLNIAFEKDGSGAITGMTIQQYGGSMFCKKLK